MQDNRSSRKRYLPDPQVWDRYGVSQMTGWRWARDPKLNFPKAIRINGRNYRDEAELEAWEREQAAATSLASNGGEAA
jgi:predicted DNA-binding transcriptional regulator AlpA